MFEGFRNHYNMHLLPWWREIADVKTGVLYLIENDEVSWGKVPKNYKWVAM